MIDIGRHRHVWARIISIRLAMAVVRFHNSLVFLASDMRRVAGSTLLALRSAGLEFA
jgi:hypothetical protein